jgi:hypothetical protein
MDRLKDFVIVYHRIYLPLSRLDNILLLRLIILFFYVTIHT